MDQPGWKFEYSYQKLPSTLFETAHPRKVKSPKGLIFNDQLASSINLDIDSLMSAAGVESLSGNTLPKGAVPISQAYAGHQFGNFTNLGDGRAILLGEHRISDEKIVDVQLKGAGRTPYSRNGDGLATLGAVLKEYIFGEAMHALGIPTTRTLAVVGTGEYVQRQKLQPGAVMTRIASSHIRIGTFEFACRGDISTLKELADYAIKRHYPELINTENPYIEFLKKMVDQQAYLVAQWMGIGFVHGVMNTDNISISGETIDYGPCAFIDEYDLRSTFSSIDRHGRYAYGNQSKIMYWNICRFAESLLPLLHPNDVDLSIKAAQEILRTFPSVYETYWQQVFCKKIGFDSVTANAVKLVNDLLEIMHDQRLDFTTTFRQLTRGTLNHPALQDWVKAWQLELLESNRDLNHDLTKASQLMQVTNPVVIPRNHVVASVIDDVETSGDLKPLLDLLEIIKNPFSEEFSGHTLAFPRPDGVPQTVTYCGT